MPPPSNYSNRFSSPPLTQRERVDAFGTRLAGSIVTHPNRYNDRRASHQEITVSKNCPNRGRSTPSTTGILGLGALKGPFQPLYQAADSAIPRRTTSTSRSRSLAPPLTPFGRIQISMTPTSMVKASQSGRMSFFQHQPDPLGSKLSITFVDGVVEMVGGANTGSSYSLPGHILLCVPALRVPIDSRKREIKELQNTLEGKSEFFDDHGRYTPMRLYTTTVNIITRLKPIGIPAYDPARPASRQITFAIPFDLRLPGWLPPTHLSALTDTSYGVIAAAVIGWVDPVQACPLAAIAPTRQTLFSLQPNRGLPRITKSSKGKTELNSSASSPPQPAVDERSTSKWTPFEIRRHKLPIAINPSAIEGEKHYSLRPDESSTSPVECVVSVPDWVNIHGGERSLRVSLRVRARRPSGQAEQASAASTRSASANGTVRSEIAVEGAREVLAAPDVASVGTPTENEIVTHMLELGMEVEELERYTNFANQAFTSTYPIPANLPTRSSTQHALLAPRDSSADTTHPPDNLPFRGFRTRPRLRADDGSQRNFFFSGKGLELGDKWRKVNVVLPMPAGVSNRPQAELDGPFLRIRHSLKIRMVCRDPAGGIMDSMIVLTVPIRFGTAPTTVPDPPKSFLPPYIQLFLENGDLRECDPLPLYTPSNRPRPDVPRRVLAEPPKSPAPDYSSLFPLNKASLSRSALPSVLEEALRRVPSDATIGVGSEEGVTAVEAGVRGIASSKVSCERGFIMGRT